MVVGTCMAQANPRQLKLDATSYFEKGKYAEALNLFLKYQRLKPEDDEIKQMIGISYFYTNNILNARRYLQYVTSNEKKPNPKAFYYIGRTFHAEGDYVNAIKFYKEYLRKTKVGEEGREGVKDKIRRCASGIRLSSRDEIAVVENLGDKINSPYDEFGPILSPNYENKIYFSSACRISSGGKRDEDGIVDNRYGKYRSDMFSSSVVNGQWSEGQPFGSLLNSTRNDVILDFSETGSVMYFFKGNDYFSGQILVDSFNKTEQNLFPSDFAGPVAGQEGDRDMFFFKDSILIFSSYRAGGKGGSDLYVTNFSNGFWSPPKNLGANINTPYDERTPFLSKDGRTLYFSSNNPQSIGGLDIFKARYDDNTLSWSTPVNMGVPINSSEDDAYFRLSKDGLKAFFSSSRKDGQGERDLYTAYFKGYQNEQRSVSIPIAFHLVPEFRRKQSNGSLVLSTSGVSPSSGESQPGNPPLTEGVVKEYKFSPLYFGEDENVLNLNNLKELNKVARLMMEQPLAKLQINSHFDGSSPAQFDLFFSIKRAEKVAEYLVDNGVKASNVYVKGSGSLYPVVRTSIESNIRNANLNRRLELSFHNTDGLPVNIVVADPEVQESFADPRSPYYLNQIKGLSYKVQVAAIRQNYISDIITTYPDAMVESSMSEDLYRYSVGLFKTYQSAELMKQELMGKGLTDVFVVPYINGLRISLAESKVYANTYPDLMTFIAKMSE